MAIYIKCKFCGKVCKPSLSTPICKSCELIKFPIEGSKIVSEILSTYHARIKQENFDLVTTNKKIQLNSLLERVKLSTTRTCLRCQGTFIGHQCNTCLQVAETAQREENQKRIQHKNDASEARVLKLKRKEAAIAIAITNFECEERKVAKTAHRNTPRSKQISGGKHTAADIMELRTLQNHRCARCKVDVQHGFHVDHIMPLALGGSNTKENLQILCQKCNLSKGAKHPDIWNLDISKK